MGSAGSADGAGGSSGELQGRETREWRPLFAEFAINTEKLKIFVIASFNLTKL